ncbi:MAG: citrate/2-methylcitrate synthase [Gemmataceae bacterium]
MSTYSPGLEGVVAGETAICTVEHGLSYRGYFVGDLAEHCLFDEVAHLLLHGELPTAAQLKAFQDRVAASAAGAAAVPRSARRPAEMDHAASTAPHRRQRPAHFDPDVNDNSHDANIRARAAARAGPAAIADHYALSRGNAPTAARQDLGHPRTSCTCSAAPSRRRSK